MLHSCRVSSGDVAGKKVEKFGGIGGINNLPGLPLLLNGIKSQSVYAKKHLSLIYSFDGFMHSL